MYKLAEMSARWSINYFIPLLAVTATKKTTGMMGLESVEGAAFNSIAV